MKRPRRMKILHIISSGGMYGAESVILNLSRMLNASSHASVLGVFSNSSNPNLQLHEAAVKEGIESHLIPCAGQVDPTVVESIRRLVAQTGADVVHAHGYKADVYVYFALRKTATPFVSTCHNWLKDGALVAFYGKVDRFVLRSYAGVVAVSDEVRATLLKAGVRAEKIHLIRNGIDMRPFAEAAPSLRIDGEKTLVVGWIGRLSSEKGADIFLRAGARVLAEFPEARFVIVGDGPDLAALNALIDDLRIRKSVSLAGRREDMPAVYASLDMMVSSSRQEGLPMAILEGMASGLPLVATAVGDVPTVVREGSTGRLVPSENVELLAAAMVELLRDDSLRRRLGSAAKELIAEEFSAERMTANYLRVYEDALTQRGVEAQKSPSVRTRKAE
ncbi:MAG: glycosyltransferase family 4 protein [Acidobacteriales bacterium]|nr:glycosyltransferase family 4 protein [Terriglobales bacterium]